MRLDVGMRQPPKVKISDDVEHTSDDVRDDTTGSKRPINLHSKAGNAVMIDSASKPLFRTTSPKVEYAAVSPYYDVLLYSFTPEQAQKQKLSTKTNSRTSSKQSTTSSTDKRVDVKSTSMNVNSVDTEPIRDQSQPTVMSVNDQVKLGDGDQSPIYDPYLHKVYLELFRTGTCSKCHFVNTIHAPGKTKKVFYFLAYVSHFLVHCVGGDFDAHIHKSSNQNNRRYINTNSMTKTNQPTLSIFAEHCVSGRYEKVKHILEKNSVRKGKSWNVMITLLETRETVLRLSPLLLVFCMLHKVGVVLMNKTNSLSSMDTKNSTNSSTASETWMKYIDQLEQNLVKVVAELLRYGASPVAKDVCGRTVYFYGASIYATPRSLNAVTMCSNAAMSVHYFGKEVILHGLDTMPTTIETDKHAVCNGMCGLAGGYQVSTGCRIVYLFGRQSEVAVAHRNMRLVNASSNAHESASNLCNVQDRLGHVCLTELLDSDRTDVIKYLLDKHHASIDIVDWTGKSIRHRSFAITTKSPTISSEPLNNEMATAQIIVAHALKCGRQEQKRIDNTCTACKKIRNNDNDFNPLQFCQRWYVKTCDVEQYMMLLSSI